MYLLYYWQSNLALKSIMSSLKTHSAYVRNALVGASKGIYSKHEYLERIFADGNYESIGEYKIKDYVERPHGYVKGE